MLWGFQITVHLLGGVVERSDKREFGPAGLSVVDSSDILSGIAEVSDVWMSHGDRVLELPEGFSVIAKSDNSPSAAVKNESIKFWGTQFHPEVVHTDEGKKILSNFVHKIAGCADSWTPEIVRRDFDCGNQGEGRRLTGSVRTIRRGGLCRGCAHYTAGNMGQAALYIRRYRG